MNPLTVVYASDQRLYQYLPMAINSLLIHNPDAKVYVFADDDKIDVLSPDKATIINSSVAKHYIKETSPQYNYYLPAATFIRLWLADLLKEDRVLWLDVDTICTGSLDDLWKLDIGADNYIAGVYDKGAPIFNLELDVEYYINAGVMLMDLWKWRELGLVERARRLANNMKWRFGDQDIVNVLCDKHIYRLSSRYNYSRVTYSENARNPVIWHFASHPKLWEIWDLVPTDYPELMELWEKYYVESL